MNNASISTNLAATVTLVDLLRRRSEGAADDIAFHQLLDDGSRGSICYAELDRRARAIARYLVRSGLQGERVAILCPHGLEYISAFFGCLYAGAVAVPCFPPRPRRPLRRIKAILEDCHAKAVLTTGGLLQELEQRVEADLKLRSLHWIASDQIARGTDESWSPPEIDGRSLALLQYTSGSTGSPKGVMVSHANLMHNLATIARGFGIEGQPSVGVSWLPMYHDMGLVGGILEPIFVGQPSVLLSPVSFLKRPAFWLETISEFGGSVSGGPNFAYRLCLERVTHEQRAKLDLSNWTTAYCGAEPIHWETLREFARVFKPCGFQLDALYPCYGMAESTLIISGIESHTEPTALAIDKSALSRDRIELVADNDDAALWSVSCGRALEQDIRIVAPESRREREPGLVGEIWVRGPSVAAGYWGREKLTREVFQAHIAGTDEGPFLRTGDVGFLHHGQLHIVGRLKDLIIIRGRNHYPQDIESTVADAHPAIRSAASAAFSVEVANDSRLIVVQELDRGQTGVDRHELMERIRAAVVAEHSIEPHAIVLVKPLSLPKTSSGKSQRFECRKQYLGDDLSVVATWDRASISAQHSNSVALTGADDANESDEEQRTHRTSGVTRQQVSNWLVKAVARKLNLSADQIDPTQPHESLGLDSVAAVSLCGDLESWLGRDISPTLLYEFGTIHALAQHLATAPPAGTSINKRDSNGVAEKGVVRSNATEAYAESIAIVGVGCRLPGGVSDPDSYWRLMCDGTDAIEEVPSDRWDVDRYYDPDPTAPGKSSTRWGGFIDDVDRFDAAFFGISPREAQTMDPQQRLLLEVTWEALENAGLSPTDLAGSRTGVFTGICNSDYSRLVRDSDNLNSIDAYAGTGCAFSVTAGRVSYLLGLRGPSMPVDTACSSSLVAVHLACQSLLRNECEVSLASGVNLMLTPDANVYFSKVRAMAADGRCKAFDESADGYVRGEGCGVVVLKRLSDAVADRDRIHAVIRGSAVNHDGTSNGLTAPNPAAQQQVIRQALAVAGVDAADVGYVETHGTGTSLGDPIEISALIEALSLGDHRDNALMAGSVKTNIGHLEAAAGIAGLIKSVLALQHREVPPMLHLRKLNARISADHRVKQLSFPIKQTPWRSANRRRVAGVSSFGFGGTNAHVILEEAPAFSRAATQERKTHLLTVSAKSPRAVNELARRYRRTLIEDPNLSLADVCHTAGLGRSHFEHRLAIVASSREELIEKLAGTHTHGDEGVIHRGRSGPQPPHIALVFTPCSVPNARLVRDLYDSWPVFRKTLEEVDREANAFDLDPIVPRLLGHSTDGTFTSTHDSSAAVFATQYALAKLWKSWGIEAEVYGTGVGHQAARCIAGACSLADAISAVIGESKTNGFAGEVTDLDGFDFAIEIRVGDTDHPQPKSAVRWLPAHSGTCRPSENDDPVDTIALLEALAELYVAGQGIDWQGIDCDRNRRRVSLPNYPFERKRYWVDRQQTVAAPTQSPNESPAATTPPAPVETATSDNSTSEIETAPSQESIETASSQALVENSSSHALVDQILAANEGARPGLMVVYLQQQIAAVMEVEESDVCPDANLFDIGMDSLMAMDVIEQLQSDFDLNLFPRELYERPKIRLLADYVSAELAQLKGEDSKPERIDSVTVKTESHVQPSLDAHGQPSLDAHGQPSLDAHGQPSLDVRGQHSPEPHVQPGPTVRSSIDPLKHRPDPQPPLSGPPVRDSVILLTAPRSGSTLLRVMLAGHGDLFSPPELHLLPFDRMDQRQAILGDSYLGEGLPRALMELLQLDASAAMERVDTWINSKTPNDEVYRVLKRLSGDRRLIDKSPTTTGNINTMRRAEVWFDAPKYIYLTRHPDAVIESLTRMRFHRLVGAVDENPHQWAERVWRNAQQNALEFLETIEPNRQCCIDFETLVKQPESSMRRLADFLQIAYEPGMLTPYAGRRMTDGLGSSARPIDDPNFRRHDRIDADAATAWSDRPQTWSLSRDSIRIAKRLGYELTWPEDSTADNSVIETQPVAQRQAITERPARPMMQEEFVSTNRRSLCCCSWGSPRNPTVLCIHGILDQGATWNLVAEQLVDRGFHVLAPDLRGHGRSPHAAPDASYGLLDFVSDADAVLKTLEDESVVLVGHSLGALVAGQLALARPERIKRLIAIEPPLPQSSQAKPDEQLAAFLDQVAADAVHSPMPDLETAIERMRRAIPVLSVEFAEQLTRRVTQKTSQGLTWRWDPRLRTRSGLSLTAQQLGTARFSDLVSRLPMPATVLIGTRSSHSSRHVADDPLTEYDVDGIAIEGGHHLTIESAHEVASIIGG